MELSEITNISHTGQMSANSHLITLREWASSLPCCKMNCAIAEQGLWEMLCTDYQTQLSPSIVPNQAHLLECLKIYTMILTAAEWSSEHPSPKRGAVSLFRLAQSQCQFTSSRSCVDILNSDSPEAEIMLDGIHSMCVLARALLAAKTQSSLRKGCGDSSDDAAEDTSVLTNQRIKRAAVCDNLDISKPYEPRCVPKSQEIRKLLMSVVRFNILFKNCSLDVLNAVVDAFESKDVSESEIVIKQGDPGDYFYVIESGLFDVYVNSEGHNSIKLGRSLGPGEYFGELALMCNTPRAATVMRSSSQQSHSRVGTRSILGTSPAAVDLNAAAVLWRLDRHMYRSIVTHFSKLTSDTFVGLIGNVKIAGSRRLGDILSSDELNRLVSSLEVEEFSPGDIIIRQHTKGDFFYVIREGCVDVFQDDVSTGALAMNNRNTLIRNVQAPLGEKLTELTRGDYFGEKALLAEDLRQASCVASTPGPSGKVICLSLSRSEFIAHLGSWQEIQHASSPDVGMEEAPSELVATQTTSAVSDNAGDSKANNTFFASISDFDVLYTLGVGAFGKVRKVQHSKSKQFFALKYLSKSFIVAQSMQEIVTSEMRITRMFHHPCIAQLYAAFQDSKYVYFLLELLPAGDFFGYLQSSGRLSEDCCRFYSASVIAAFECLHSKKIAYRDLKPENMVMDARGYVKLVDLGLAKQIPEDGGKTWTMCGTPDYLAPEIVLNQGHDHCVDYWALGVLIYEIINGLPPFYNENSLRIFEKIAKPGKITFPDGTLFSNHAKDLIEKLLVRNPSKRLGNMKGKISDICKHKWFASFDWNGLLLGVLEPAFVPVPSQTSLVDDEVDAKCEECDWIMDLT